MTTPENFDSALSTWKREQSTPWGRLRYTIARANLARHLPQRPLRILDAGGGNGWDSIAYAQEGHRVALVDYSAGMLKEACAAARSAQVGDYVDTIHAAIEETPTLFPTPVFDLALCHNVVQYVDDPGTMLQALGTAIKPDGLLSLVGVNRYSDSFRAALFQLDLPQALEKLGSRSTAAVVFETSLRLYAVEDLIEPLERAGFAMIGQYGLRCVCDYIPDNDVKFNPVFFADLERLELALTDQYPYRHLARYFQIIARKTAAVPF